MPDDFMKAVITGLEKCLKVTEIIIIMCCVYYFFLQTFLKSHKNSNFFVAFFPVQLLMIQAITHIYIA